MPAKSHFASQLLNWYDIHGRHDLPWQVKDNPYQVWVSEIMLQQTQVKTVLNYYDKFIQRFPSVNDLAQAEWEDVAPYWAGLGYYARARNLHKASRQVVAQGFFPQDLDGLMALSGVGRSTAGALMSLGLDKFGVILDGNVKRVLSRYFAISGDLSKKSNENQLWQLAEQLTPHDRHADYTQAIMDLGATICTPKKPLCLYCPMQTHCQALKMDRVLDFPEKKQKKTVPTKHAHVIILQNEKNQWLWQKRPNDGLWGGLYSLPIIENDDEFTEFLIQIKHHNTAKNPIKTVKNHTIKHQFTHFTWLLNCHLIPYSKQLDDKTITSIQEKYDWQNGDFFTPEQAITLGIPTAMQKIIDAFL